VNGEVCSASACSCPASTEICNGRDDDCNGSIDEGCPRSISVGALVDASPYFGGDGGDSFDSFSATVAQTGYDGHAAAVIQRVEALGAAPVLRVDASSMPEHAFRVGWEPPLAYFGAAGSSTGSSFSDRCPPDQFVTGIRGAYGSLIGSLGAHCSRIDLLRIDGNWAVVVTEQSEIAVRGGGGGSRFAFRCRSGSVAVGFFGRAGSAIDGIGLLCRELTIEY
jgi:hypothetical protein